MRVAAPVIQEPFVPVICKSFYKEPSICVLSRLLELRKRDEERTVKTPGHLQITSAANF